MSLGISVSVNSYIVIHECIVEVTNGIPYTDNQYLIIGDGSGLPQVANDVLSLTQSGVYRLPLTVHRDRRSSMVSGQDLSIRSGTAFAFMSSVNYGNPTLGSTAGSGLNASYNVTVFYHLVNL